MKVLITGATGLIGSEIVKQCHKRNIIVNYLTTNKSKIKNQDNYRGFYWNINTKEIDVKCFENVSVIIHLAGASISKRWTKTYKEVILNSRIQSTLLLYNTLKNNSHTVTHIISGSAIGIYPNSYTNYYTENEKNISASFLGQVVNTWENTINTFKTLNINVTKVRIGLVFAKNGGAFPKLLKPIKYGFGAFMGNGKQWQSWIYIHDLAAIFIHIIDNKLTGVYNGVAANPETNKTITKAIAKHIKRPLFLPNTPKFLMKLILGEMHILLFESQKVSSKKIENTGFKFKYNDFNEALKELT